MSLIGIGSSSEKDGVTYYQIEITLPLRALTVSRRYSEFVTLVDQLCEELGISSRDFLYQLPPKGSFFSSKARLVSERKYGLSEFLNAVVRDRDLQNRKPVHDFLQLPANFKFTPAMFEDGNGSNDNKFLIDEEPQDIDSMQWLTYLRQVRAALADIPQGDDIESRKKAREQVNKYIQPNVQKLASALSHLNQNGEIDSSEFSQRTSSLREILNETERLVFKRESKSKKESSPHYNFTKRLGKKDDAKETDETLGVSNKELLQQQQQIHKDQDQEVEELRKIIAKQREIGETIGKEVEEHNEMLDRFTDEVDASSEKMKDARARAKRIT